MPEPSVAIGGRRRAGSGEAHEVPAQRVGPDGLHHLLGVGVVAQLLGQLATLGVEHHAVADHVAERGLVEQRHRQHVQRVEPAAGLGDVLDDEVGRAVLSNHSLFSNG
jgi:hypothetical protein